MQGQGESKRPTRDYRSYSATPWGIWDTLYSRRSCRKYDPYVMDGSFAGELEQLSIGSMRVRDAVATDILSVTDELTVQRVRRGSYRGLQNKINLWLAGSPVCGFLVMALPKEEISRDRPCRMARAAMVLEDAVLWLTERGLGSCWLGGVNEREVGKVLELSRETGIPAVVCFGKPRKPGFFPSYDNLTYRTLSRRRKPLGRIAAVERADNPYQVGELRTEGFCAPPIQDVRGLLDGLGGDGEREVPLGLAIESCLEAGRVAPSGGNMQHWKFVVVRKKDRLKELSEACGVNAGWRTAVVAAGQVRAFETILLDKPFWMLDVPIALSQMSLVASSMGCGVDVILEGIREGYINRLVGLPHGHRTVGVLGLRARWTRT